MIKYIVSLFFWVPISLFGQETFKVTAGKHNDYGLTYSLPKTLANIDVQATKVISKAGPYYQYAEKYLGVKDIITEDVTYWTIDKINIDATAQANPSEIYLVRFKAGNPPSFYLTEQGSLLSINMEPNLVEHSNGKKIEDTKKTPSTAAYSVLSEEQLTAGSTAKMAEIAAKQIYRIRESRLNLVTGDVDQLPADGESFKLIMAQLNEQEAILTAMFIGTVQKETMSKSFHVDPLDYIDKNIVFRFSKYLGFVSNEDLGGVPVYLKTAIQEDLRTSGNEARSKKDKGVAYTLPGKAILTLSSENKTINEVEMSVAQLGTTAQFPTDMFDDKKAPAKALFVPETGAVLEIIH